MKYFILVFAFMLSLLPVISVAQDPGASAERMENRIKKLGEFGWSETGSQRVAFSDADLAARKYFISLMKAAGLKVKIDFAGNIIGLRDGRLSDQPPIMFGSHLDTVPNGGMYDGIVGSVGALEVIELLNQKDIRTNHPIEIIIFSDEEGGLTGSRALIGKLGPDALKVKSHSGKTIAEGIKFLGGDPERLLEIKRNRGDIAAFVELHIEQGGILDSGNLNIGNRAGNCRDRMVGRHDRGICKSCGNHADEREKRCRHCRIEVRACRQRDRTFI